MTELSYTQVCPECAGAVVRSCKCILGHKRCAGGHMWHCDWKNHVANMLDGTVQDMHGEEPLLKVIPFNQATIEEHQMWLARSKK